MTTAENALATFRKYYPGPLRRHRAGVRHRLGARSRGPWPASPSTTAPGRLRRFWPKVIEPEGRVQFVGAYADNLNWGMEAATRSANRVAKAIDQA